MDLDKLFSKTPWTEEALAQRAGVHQATISRLRRRLQPTPLGRALQIAKATRGLVKLRDLELSPDARVALKLLRAEGCRHV